MKQEGILILDFDRTNPLSDSLRKVLETFPSNPEIRQESIDYTKLAFCEAYLPAISRGYNPMLIFLIISPGLLDQSISVVESIRQLMPVVPILVSIESADPDLVFELLKFKAIDFVTPPFHSLDIFPRMRRLLEQGMTEDSVINTVKQRHGFRRLIGESPAFLKEIEKVCFIASCDSSVLILGETGTGKELFARSIHYLSQRASKPFIPVNCGAIPMELMESELFGYERGAFTGATTSHSGLIHEARGGTLFLDEIDSLPLLSQVKLLRFLQEKEYRSLGSPKVNKADVRVIAASNADFEDAVNKGKLRQDLYYRLNVMQLKLPPLRERHEDIPLLARHFLGKYSLELKKKVTSLSEEALQKLVLYDWPGNVRELEHVIERAVVFCNGHTVEAHHVSLPRMATVASKQSFQQMKAEVISQFEKRYINVLLHAYGGNISRAARAAQKNRRAFWQLITKHKIDVERIKAGTHTAIESSQ
jgi:two-component system, NtrC family, response regulator GlrR